MFLDKGKHVQFQKAMIVFDAKNQGSILKHHEPCCQVARSWFLGIDKSSMIFQNASGMPIWIREKYRWGPSPWPLYWCEATVSETLDCGALAALTRESLHVREIPTLPVQLIVLVTEQDSAHWSKLWQDNGFSRDWIVSPFIYHEVCGVLSKSGDELRLWDPSGNCWIDSMQDVGFRRPVGLRVFADDRSILQWGDRKINTNKWTVLAEFA